MQVENIDIDALIILTKQTVYNLDQIVNSELSTEVGDGVYRESKDDSKAKAKEMLLSLTHDTICNQVECILGIQSKKEFADMREKLDVKVCEFIDNDVSLDDLIRFIQNLYIELLKMESEELEKRFKAVLEKKTIMIGRQCMGH